MGALAVHAMRAVGVEDIGFVAVGGVGAADDPTVLALEVADLHEGLLEVFLINNMTACGCNENVGGAGRAAINLDNTAVVLLAHAGTIDVEGDLGACFTTSAGRIGNRQPVASSDDTSVIIESSATQVNKRDFSCFGRKASVDKVFVYSHDRVAALGNVFALDVVKVELGVPFVATAGFVGAEGEAGESLDVHIVEA